MEYWTELEDRAGHVAGQDELLAEIGRLRGQLSFLESRLQQCASVLGMELVNKQRKPEKQ